jgi:hypothetical protein
MVALLIAISTVPARASGGPSYRPRAEASPAQDTVPDGVDERLVRRWADLFAYVIGEFQADHRDLIGNVEGDFSTRLLRVRQAEPESESWASVTLTEQELATGDLPAIARNLYTASNLVKRWSQLVAYVLADFQADHRDPTANIEADYSAKIVRVRRTEGRPEAWATRVYTAQELARADLRVLARELYAASKRSK